MRLPGFKIKIRHGGHRLRMFKKLECYGLSSFNIHQAIELLLFFIIPRIDTNIMAHRLEFDFKSVENLLCASTKDLLDEDGLGEKSRSKLLCAGMCFQTFMRNAKLLQLASYESLYAFCVAADVQSISVAILDDKLRVQRVLTVQELPLNMHANVFKIDDVYKSANAAYCMLMVPVGNRIDNEMLEQVEFYQRCLIKTGLKLLDTLLICSDARGEKTLIVAVCSESCIIDSYTVTKETFLHTKLYGNAKRQDDVTYDVFFS